MFNQKFPLQSPTDNSSYHLLLVETDGAARSVMHHLVSTALPEAELIDHPEAQGCPAVADQLGRFDAVLLYARVAGIRQDQKTWLENMLAVPECPPVMVVTSDSDAADDDVQRMLAGPGCIELTRQDLSMQVFGDKMRGILTRESRTARMNLTMTAVMSPARARQVRGEPDSGTGPAVTTGARARRGSEPPDVPGYRLVSQVGAGGMATVYLARPEAGGDEEVILKVVRVEDAGSNVILRRFLREFRISGQLSHPNIVRIYERGFANDFAYIAMEHCSGGDLRGRIKTHIDPEQARAYLQAIASGLGEAHRHGIIHRDVKPANVLFRSDDSVVLTDFGIAKAREAAASLTMTNAMVGTPHYISPEQVRGVEIDSRADLYSLGVLYYEMLTGGRPFYAERVVELLDAHLHREVPKLPEHCARQQPIVDRLLAKQPDQRFQTAEEVLEAIEAT